MFKHFILTSPKEINCLQNWAHQDNAYLMVYTCVFHNGITCKIINPNHPKSSKGHFFGKKTAQLETGTFTSSNGAKLLLDKKYRS